MENIKTGNEITRTEKILLAIFGLSVFVVYACIFHYSDGLAGGQDSYMHYLISRYSFKHPELLLDQWGKPVFTFISAPFSNLGLNGLVYFNIFCAIGAGFFTFLAAKKTGINNSILAFLFVCFSPVLLGNTISGLTEILNALIVSLVLYLYVSENKTASAILASFLPFVRTEGFIILGVIAFFFLIKKEYKLLVFLATGSVVLNTFAWTITGDALWILNKNPYYIVEKNLCGSGPWNHYYLNRIDIFGKRLWQLLVIGLIYVVFLIFRAIKYKRYVQFTLFNTIVICGIFFGYIGAHSVVWWKGMIGSCGYIRVMAVIAPVSAIISLHGYNLIVKFFAKINWLKILFTVLLLGFIIKDALIVSGVPFQLDGEQREFKKVAEWLKENPAVYQNNKIYSLYPYLYVLMDLDPYDRNKTDFLWNFFEEHSPDGSIIIWDAHFGPNEGNQQLEKYLGHPEDFKLLKVFKPDPPFEVMNGYDYGIYVFQFTKK